MKVKIVRASSLGHPCVLRTWYQVNGGEGTFPSRLKHLFDLGHAIEPVAVKWLEELGWTVIYNPGSQQAADVIRTIIPGGEIEGHHDLIAYHPEHGWVVIDIKTMGSHVYAIWKTDGTAKAMPQYVGQLMIYTDGLCRAGTFPIDPGTDPRTMKMAIAGVNRDTGEMELDFVAWDDGLYREMLIRAEVACTSEEPPYPDQAPGGHVCNFCPFNDRCPIYEYLPANDAATNLTLNVDDEHLEAAAIALEIARVDKKDAELREETAKAIIDKQIGIHQVAAVVTEKRFVERKVSKQRRFNADKLKAERPDIYAKFLVEGSTVRYTTKDMELPWNA